MAASNHENAGAGNANLPSGGESQAMQGKPEAKTETAIQSAEGSRGCAIWERHSSESSEAIQHVIFHLADSLAQSALRYFEEELKFLPDEKRDAELRKRIDEWIDAGHGEKVIE